MDTKFFRLYQEKKFAAAIATLRGELLEGNVIDPRFDSIWAKLADQVLAASNPTREVKVELAYWGDWLSFFLNMVEPKWGHAHKGHIYFRLGFSYAQIDESKAIENFEKAYQENCVSAISDGLSGLALKEHCQNKSSYVALCLLERMDLLDFNSYEDRKIFISQIFSEAFDRVIQGLFHNPKEVSSSIEILIKDTAALEHCKQVYAELQLVSQAGLTYAILSSTGSVLETILFSNLLGKPILNKEGKKINKPTLGSLFNAAVQHNLFPNDRVKASCRLISHLRNRIHSRNTLNAKYPLIPRASLTLKTLLEGSLIEWASLP